MSCLIRTPADHVLFADPRSFSQLTTSFFAFESLGIPHTPFITSFRFTYVLVARYTLVHLKLFTTYFSTLFLQYVNELFVRITPIFQFRMAIPPLLFGTNNVIISPQSAVDSRLLLCLLPISTFQFQSNLVRLTLFLILLLKSCNLKSCGEYRIRTDDPLLAKQVL